jgi:hypothetical protein
MAGGRAAKAQHGALLFPGLQDPLQFETNLRREWQLPHATELTVNAASSCAFRGRDYHARCSPSPSPDRHHTPILNAGGLPTRSKPLFAIDWLSRGVPVERETSVLTDLDAVVALTHSRAPDVAMRHPGREPDSFRLTDATGLVFGVFPVRRKT